jgi:hypothetical protein
VPPKYPCYTKTRGPRRHARTARTIRDQGEPPQRRYDEHALQLGFDLLFSQDQRITDNFTTTFINLNVKAEMSYIERSRTNPCNCVVNSNTVANTDGSWGTPPKPATSGRSPAGFFVFPRSSMSKPLILANHTGIIGHRGNLMVGEKVSCSWDRTTHDVEMFERLFQITHPSLCRVLSLW